MKQYKFCKEELGDCKATVDKDRGVHDAFNESKAENENSKPNEKAGDTVVNCIALNKLKAEYAGLINAEQDYMDGKFWKYL